MSRLIALFCLLCGLSILSACAESVHQVQRTAESLGIPLELENEIDRSVRFADLQQAPSEYVGRTVMLGGTVIKGKRTKEGTELEVLQRPTGEEGKLTEDRLRSEGRFLAVQETFLDPATFPQGTPITVIGTVKGVTTRRLDESDYVYPVLEVKHVIDWKTVASQNRDRSLYYGSYYPPYGLGGFYPYGAYPYSYWGGPGFYRPYPYYFGPGFSPGPSSPPPPPPSVSPRLRGR
ncbi:MAG TPA: Slp family lipoprotein [Nitrospira sp.]|jgi:outer membrane lipoprotein|nr:Slp family lipoprotein [Nitrospira sp.]